MVIPPNQSVRVSCHISIGPIAERIPVLFEPNPKWPWPDGLEVPETLTTVSTGSRVNIQVNNSTKHPIILRTVLGRIQLVKSVTPLEVKQVTAEICPRSSTADKFQLNQAKCKELRITFAKTVRCFVPVYVKKLPIEVVPNGKILGLRISKDLKWNAHISDIVKKVSTRLYLILLQLKRARIHPSDLLTFYKTCLRPVMEYTCPVFLGSLHIYLSEELEKLQRRAFRIIYPTLSYREALVEADVVSLFGRRQDLTSKFLNNIVNDEGHKLYELLPCRNFSNYNLRKEGIFKGFNGGIETVLFCTVLQCITDNLYNML